MKASIFEKVQPDLESTLIQCPIQQVYTNAALRGSRAAARAALERRVKLRLLLERNQVLQSKASESEQQRIADKALQNAMRLRAAMDEVSGLQQTVV